MTIALTIAGILYPILVVFGHSVVPPFLLIAIACFLIMLRVWDMSRKGHPLFVSVKGAWASIVCFVALIGLGLAFAAPITAAKFYPVAVSLGVAFTFAASLAAPPSLVERLARLREPDLPPEATSYCRKVTWLWAGWLTANGAIAAALALWASDAVWALWTGLINYGVSGLLFAGEFAVRYFMRRPGATA